MQLSFYFDQTRCTGCLTCLMACKDWHEYDLGTEPENWIDVTEIEKGKFPEVFVAYLARPCYHCEHPPCVSACPVDAITKREEDGIVVVDREGCLGNENCKAFCRSACPYSVPCFGPEADAKMQKCDLCLDRWENGQKPVCVEACPMRALDAAPLDELLLKAGSGKDIHQAEGFVYSADAMPSIVFNPRLNTSP